MEDKQGLRSVRRHSDMSDKVALFNKIATAHSEKQLLNPFSEWDGASTRPRKISREDENYGRPEAGSKTAERGAKAAKEINNELKLLCEVIYDCGQKYEDDTAEILFGDLFQMYTRISSKCVGLLIRARKYKLVDFEGETLFQRQDDDKVITLLKPMKEIRVTKDLLKLEPAKIIAPQTEQNSNIDLKCVEESLTEEQNSVLVQQTETCLFSPSDEQDALVVAENMKPEAEFMLVPQTETVLVPQIETAIVPHAVAPDSETMLVTQTETVLFSPSDSLTYDQQTETVVVPHTEDVMIPQAETMVMEQEEVSYVTQTEGIIVVPEQEL